MLGARSVLRREEQEDGQAVSGSLQEGWLVGWLVVVTRRIRISRRGPGSAAETGQRGEVYGKNVIVVRAKGRMASFIPYLSASESKEATGGEQTERSCWT